MHPGRFFRAKACYKVVFKSAKIPEAIVFHSDPYYYVLPYLMIIFKEQVSSIKTPSSTGV